MRYFALHNGDHKLVGIGTGIGGNEITKEEYDEIFDESVKRKIWSNNFSMEK